MSNLPLDQMDPDEHETNEMSFLDHLEELRWHIIRAFIAITAFTVGAFASKELVFGTIILGPSKTDFWTYRWLCQLGDLLQTQAICIDTLPFILQSRQMTGQFTMHIASSFAIGLICAFPYAFWEIWRFISPGLYINEKKVARGAVFWVSFLFMIGVAFGYLILTPLSVNFLSNYQIDPSILNEFDIISYVSTVTTLVLACGLLFQLPMVVLFLTKAGIITPAIMKAYRKHGIVVIFFLGALLTPPDPFSQILIAIPLIGLYQISITVSKRAYKNREKELIKL
ncbi:MULTISPECIES: twin-arginine translocase subunit TatC [Reichenbachiella]|uniref:Sec-independent protein translocase protein TatC n=1 Tax=Reichenbachiella agariperforans TaxID=156994 RepID=A0A1M6Q9X4_REIAG|nr:MULTISPECIES: twin-arginine translocase subunit TatC [Reichenbachiella]RJE73011.1 twin arginine-targeting protein translocase TatC [Reichenbachiella sp. MSK19-1]SHK16958.1 sec-independent protein translocase protein TatC [Reichenbachiella agariperforans]